MYSKIKLFSLLSSMESLLRKVRYIQEQTSTGKKENKSQREFEDEFSRKLHHINKELKEVRDLLGERNQKRGTYQKEALHWAKLKVKIDNITKDASALRGLVKKTTGGTPPPAVIEKRQKFCDLVDAHLDEVKQWARGQTPMLARNDPKRKALLQGADFNPNANPVLLEMPPDGNPTYTDLQDIEGYDEWKAHFDENERILHGQIDEVGRLSKELGYKAVQIGDEGKKLDDLIDHNSRKIEDTQERVLDTTRKVDALLEKMNKGSCLLDVILIVTIGLCIYFIVSKFA